MPGIFEHDKWSPAQPPLTGPTRALYFWRTGPCQRTLLQKHLLEAVQAHAGEVVVDLEHATYIDSAGLGVLVSAHNRLMARGGNLVTCSPTPRSMKSLEIAGLSSYLNIEA